MATREEDLTHGIPGHINVSELIETAQREFFEDPNVIGVRIGERRKGGETQRDEIALIVLVKEKILKKEVAKPHLIPPDFQGIATDVVAPFGPDAPKEALGFSDSHEHSDDMSFVSWERLNEHWTAESGGEIASHGNNVQDFGDVCVIEDDGTLIQTVGGSNTVDFVRAYELFRTTHLDIYDYVTFFTDTANGMPPQGGSSWYRFVFNDTEGIGFSPTWDLRSSYNSGTLQGIMFLNQGHIPVWRYVMLQEQAHRWGAFSRYRDTATDLDQNDHMLNRGLEVQSLSLSQASKPVELEQPPLIIPPNDVMPYTNNPEGRLIAFVPDQTPNAGGDGIVFQIDLLAAGPIQ